MARAACDLGVARADRGADGRRDDPRRDRRRSPGCSTRSRRRASRRRRRGRTQIIHAFRARTPRPSTACSALKGLTFLFFYGLPDEAGRNPNWEAIGFPGPNSAPPSAEEAPKTLTVEEVSGRDGHARPATSAWSARAPAAASSPRSARRPARTCSCSRWAATATSRTSRNLEVPGYFELYYGGGLRRDRVGLDRDPRRADARRRDRRQLHELRPHARTRSSPSGRATGSRAGRRLVRLRPHGRRDRAHRREHRGDQAEQHPPEAAWRAATSSATSTGRSGATRRSTTTPSSAATARSAASRAASARR